MTMKLSDWILNCPRLTTREEIAGKVVQLEAEFDKLVRYVRANHVFGMNTDPDKSMELAKKSTIAYQAISDETRKAIEEEQELLAVDGHMILVLRDRMQLPTTARTW